MKLRTVKHVVKEGLSNILRNKLMAIASILIVAATLMIFGIFYLVTTNLDYNAKQMQAQPEIQVYCSPELDDEMVEQVQLTVERNTGVKSTEIVTKKQAYDKVAKMLGENKGLLEGLDESFLSVSFIVKLVNPEEGSSVVEELTQINGVEKVTFPEETILFVSKINRWIQIVSIILIIILLIISMFIISNTIKLTVFARRKEINIMKYIGGTDWFIRFPFIVEGVIIGFAGALAAFIAVSIGYNAIQTKFNEDLLNISISFITLLPLKEVALQMLFGYLAIGSLVGGLGSAVSIRKHLKV